MRRLQPLAVVLVLLVIGSLGLLGACQQAAPLPAPEREPMKVLLMPLDSRPVNTQHPQLLARLAGCELIMPPPELLDSYTRPSDTDGLLRWLEQSMGEVDGAIIAANNPLAGGLIASRHPAAYAGLDERLERLATTLERYPEVDVTLICVLPRQLPTQFANPGWAHRDRLARYGQLLDKRAQGAATEQDLADLASLAAALPAKIRTDYLAVYASSRSIGQQLLDATLAGWVDNLVFTLDDAAGYGLSNMHRRELLQAAVDRGVAERVHSLTGADETSMLALARMLIQQSGARPAWQVRYQRASDASLVLRYESEPLSTAIAEKTSFVGAFPPDGEQPNQLFVHARPGEDGVSRMAADLREEHSRGRLTGVIDVALINQSDQPFIRSLLMQTGGAAIDSYAGWNTASNSIGSVVAHLAVRNVLNLRQRGQAPIESSLLRDQLAADLEYRFLHFADEGSYQAEARTALTAWLREQRIAVEPLPHGHRAQVDGQLSKLMHPLLSDWSSLLQGEYQYRFSRDSSFTLSVTAWRWEVHLPWPRPFEVQVIPTVETSP